MTETTDPVAIKKVVASSLSMFEKELCELIDELGPALMEEAQALAALAPDQAKRTACLHLRIDLQADWSKVTPRLRATLAQRVALSQPAETARYTDQALANLHILSDDELTVQLAMRELIDRVTSACGEETFALERRLAHLVLRDALPRGDSPFRIDAVCACIESACAAVFPEPARRILLLQMVGGHLVSELPQLYRAINENLIDADILPRLKRNYRDTAPATAAAAEAEASKMTSTLERLVKARTPAGSAPAHETKVGGREFLDSLKTLPKAPAKEPAGTYTNVVRMAGDSEAARNVRPIEAVTIEIVSTLFDLIFGDEHVAPGIKALVSQLQMPVLKVAMVNQHFFADRSHPARRFLDSLSGIAIRWGKTVNTDDPFYRKLSELVDRIQHTYDRDISVFEVAISELADFIAEREVIEAEANRELAEAVRAREEEIRVQREGQARAQQIANQSLTPLLKQRLPEAIEGFLRNYWRDVLQGRIFSSGPDGAPFREALQSALELIWSVGPKKEADERRQQLSLLPALLKKLNGGLDEIGVTTEERKAFMDLLVELQLAALRAEKPVKPKVARSAAEPPPIKGPGPTLQVSHATKSGVHVQDISLPGSEALSAENTPDPTNLRRVRQMVRGDWVDFVGIGPTRRERLTWINPSRSLLLFSNHASECAISITPEALALRLRNRTRDTPMFERALHGAVQSMEAQKK